MRLEIDEMKYFFFMILSALTGSTLWAQKEQSSCDIINLGDSTVKINRHYKAIESDILFINVHEDEQTSIEAVHIIAENTDLNFVYLEHTGSRRINFNHKKRVYSVDPNRIYTIKGRKATLKDGGDYSWRAGRMTRRLAKSILSLIEDNMTVVAMHNNTDVNYSIKSYLPEGDEAPNTKEVFINPEMDPDDFVYTTEKVFYDRLKSRNVNVILQDNEACVNDGSLSVYCGKKGIPYINIEAQKGHLEEQVELTKIVLEILVE